MAGPKMVNPWQQQMAAHKEHGEHKDVLADTSEDNLEQVWRRWLAYCVEADIFDPIAALSKAYPWTIKTFFDFLNKGGTVQRKSNQTYFRRLKQHIKRINGQDLDAKTSKDVGNYINKHLKQKPTSPRPRDLASAPDFPQFLEFLYLQDTTSYPDERQRVQQAFLMQIMAYSALRPSSTTSPSPTTAAKRKRGLVGSRNSGKNARQKKDTATHIQIEDDDANLEDDEKVSKEEASETVEENEVRLKYGDFRLFLILDDNSQVRLGIEPTYKRFKGEKNREQWKTFTYWALPYVPACPAATLLALALHDGALQDISSVNDLVKLRIPPGMDQIELYWSEDWYSVCIMRESSYGEPHKELSSAKARYRLNRLGENMGLRYRFVAYCLRRFCLNMLSVKAGEQVRRHVAGHVKDHTYEAHYIDQRIVVDVVNIVSGNPTLEGLTERLHRMTAGADPSVNAPLSEEVKQHIDTTPDLAALLARRDEIRVAINCECEDKLTFLHEQRKDCNKKIKALRQRYAKEYRSGHFKRKNQSVVRAQLDGHDYDALVASLQPAPLPKKTCLEERMYLGNFPDKGSDWSPTVAKYWAHGLRVMQSLCGRVERIFDRSEPTNTVSEHQQKEQLEPPASPREQITRKDDNPFPYVCAPSQCLFCLGDERKSYGERAKEWRPTHVFWRHVKTQHLKNVEDSIIVSCPHPICRARGTTLTNKMCFLIHAETEHNIRLQKTC